MQSTRITFTVAGEPASKERPRTVRAATGRPTTYTPRRTLQAEAAVAAAWLQAGGRTQRDPHATYTVTVAFHNGTRRRRDVDNMLKLVLDALNGHAWLDDAQVTAVHATKVHDPGCPHTTVTIDRNDADE